MRIFTIQEGTHKGKHIHVTRYVTTAAGVEIKISHNVPTAAGKQMPCPALTASTPQFEATPIYPTALVFSS